MINDFSIFFKVRIKCKDLVKKLAVYKNRLAVQLPDKVVIYELESNDPKDMNYKGKRNISKKFDCNLFVITSENLVICQVIWSFFLKLNSIKISHNM